MPLREERPAEVQEQIEAYVEAQIDKYLGNMLENGDVGEQEALELLWERVGERIRHRAERQDLSKEDAVERAARREKAVNRAVQLGDSVIRYNSDGSSQEIDHLLAQVAHAFTRKLVMSTQHLMLRRDIVTGVERLENSKPA